MLRVVTAAAVALLAFPATASGNPLRDCSWDHDLDERYSLAELKEAIDDIPTDQDEYGLCREVLRNAMHDDGPGGREPASASSAVTPHEQARRDEDVRELEAIAGGSAPSDEPRGAAGPETRGTGGAVDLSAGDDFPTPLLLALVALGVITVGAGLFGLRS